MTQENDRLTDTDLDVLSGMMIIFMHSAERIIQMIEFAYEEQYRAGNDYKYYCKLYGKARADMEVHKQTQKIIRGDERNKLGKILKAAKDFHYHMQALTKSGSEAHREGIADWQAQDAIVHDVNKLCYMYALIGNCPTDEDEIKIMSTIKILAKDNRVSERILERLKPKE